MSSEAAAGQGQAAALAASPGPAHPQRLGSTRSTSSGRVTAVLGRIVVTVFVLFMVVFILGPLLWLAIRAFASGWTYPNLLPDGWTLRWWRTVFEDAQLGAAVQNYLVVSPLAVVVCAVLRLPGAAAFRR